MAMWPATLPIDVILANSKALRIVQAVADLFARVDASMSSPAHACRRCGQCCRFAEFGHRLFVTPMELSYLVAHVDLVRMGDPTSPEKCPYLWNDACGIHPHRLLSCRVFLCQGPEEDPQAPIGEEWHGILRGLHETHCVPYCYVDWPHAARQLGTAQGPEGDQQPIR